MYLTGVLQCLGMVFITAFFNIYIKYSIDVYHIKPVFFAFVYFIVTSWSLLLVAGPGKFAIDTIKLPSTWLYGIMLIALSAVNLYLVKYVFGTELAILGRLSVPVALVSALLFFKRVPSKFDFINFIVICLAVAGILFIQSNNFVIIMQIAIIAAIIQFLQFMLAEVNKQSKISHEEGDLKDRMRVSAFATFVTTLMMFVITVIVSVVAYKMPSLEIHKYLPFVPQIEDFSHMPTVISASVFGLLLSPFMRYFQWSSSYKIKTENVLTILALVPLTTLIFEYIFSLFGIVSFSNLFESERGLLVFYITLVLTLTSILTAGIKTLKELKKVEGKTFIDKFKNSIKLDSQVMAIGVNQNSIADYEIIKNTIDFYEGDITKAAKMLELPLDTVKTLNLTKKAYSLRDDVSKKVHDIFRNKIFYLDQLTGVENKKGLIRQFAEYNDAGVAFNLYYMDINKFKQINDTLGHDVGDIAIIKSVHRIRDYAKQNSGFAYRLGGDEFAMITTSAKSEEQIIQEVKDVVNQPIKYNQNGNKGVLSPTISIGRANLIKDSDIKIAELIKSADENMYKDKKEVK